MVRRLGRDVRHLLLLDQLVAGRWQPSTGSGRGFRCRAGERYFPRSHENRWGADLLHAPLDARGGLGQVAAIALGRGARRYRTGLARGAVAGAPEPGDPLYLRGSARSRHTDRQRRVFPADQSPIRGHRNPDLRLRGVGRHLRPGSTSYPSPNLDAGRHVSGDYRRGVPRLAGLPTRTAGRAAPARCVTACVVRQVAQGY
ncbi:Uncharacterised protein [Mycobacteroides abscessus]|nr:Uncharacterised protein [Mycobacteroides abscessus]